MAGPRVLLIDDDPILADMVTRYLQRDGYRVDRLGDAALVAESVATTAPDLLILDLLLPNGDGRDICRQIRRASAVPILMLTGLGEESDRVAGFEAGADDYLTKPFSLRELVLRVRAILRRRHPTALGEGSDAIRRDGDLTVDTHSGEVRRAGQPVTLTSREYDLLLYFLRHPREVFSRQQILEHVWGWSHGDPSTVTVQVRRLREKIETNPNQPQRLVTVWGVGYRYHSVDL